jgi:streptogramin lyase
MLALYRCGRQAEALDAYQQGRRLLSEQLGLEPGPALRRLEKAILAQDPSLPLDELRLPEAAREEGKTGKRRAGLLRGPRLAIVLGALLLAGALAGALVAVTGGSGAVTVLANSIAVVDPETGKIVADIPIGGRPVGIAVGAGAVWVANADKQTVLRIDPQTKKLVETIGLGRDVSDITVGFGAVWAAGGNDGTLTKIDPHLNTPEQDIDVGRPGELLPQPLFLVATGAGNVWATRGNTVLRVDPHRNEVTARIAVTSPLGVGAGAGSVWVPKENEHLVRIDVRSAEITDDRDLSAQLHWPVVQGRSVWLVAYGETAAILRVKAGTLAPAASISFPKGFPFGLARGEGALWTTDHDTGVLWRIDPTTDRASAFVKVGHHPIAVAAGEGSVWVGVQQQQFS